MKKILLSTLLILGFTYIGYAQKKISPETIKVIATMQYIQDYYVDTIDNKAYTETVIKEMLNQLDPHSSYISADDVKAMNEPLLGNFEGIGISFNIAMSDTLYVIETIAGGPSEKIGIRAGDKIIYVNDTLIAGVKTSNNDVIRMLRGKKGTKVNVRVLRKGFDDLLSFNITRDKIPIYSLDASYMVNRETGYIRLSRFGATTHDEFKKAMKQLRKEGMESLILDLESNGGGYLMAAIELAQEFLNRDDLIVYTQGATQPRSEAKANGLGTFKDGKLVVLINDNSASASEILAGAIQDQDRGIVVGRRSYGKGLVQRQFELPDNSEIRLTIARYHTPTGRSIQRPYEAGASDKYRMEVYERYNNGELMHGDSIHFADSLQYRTLKNNRIVYGGGGIMPDCYVPLDTLKYPPYYRELAARGLFYKVAYSEVDQHRDRIKKEYPTADDFYKRYTVPQDVLDRVIEEGKNEKVEFNEDEFKIAKPQIEMYMKALIARDVYDTQTSYKVFNDSSDAFKKAMEIISDDELYNTLLTKGMTIRTE